MEKEALKQLIEIAENASDEKSKEAMKKLREIDPTYHWCTEWDDMVICSSDPEASCCTCEK